MRKRRMFKKWFLITIIWVVAIVTIFLVNNMHPNYKHYETVIDGVSYVCDEFGVGQLGCFVDD